MTRELHYARMEPEDFSEDLKEIGVSADDFARITGSNRMRVIKWLKGRDDLPPWVPVFCALLKLPGAVKVAEDAAAFYLEAEAEAEEDS